MAVEPASMATTVALNEAKEERASRSLMGLSWRTERGSGSGERGSVTRRVCRGGETKRRAGRVRERKAGERVVRGREDGLGRMAATSPPRDG